MKEEKFLEHMVDALQCYWSPFVMVSQSIDLTFLNAKAQGFGKIIQLTAADERRFSQMTYKENTDDITFGFVMRIFDWSPSEYLLIVGEAVKNEWYSNGMLISKTVLANKTSFRRPETH